MTLVVLVLLELSLAALPHVHHDDAVRVGELHRGHGAEGSCLVAPIELLPAPACLACASHLPSAAAPSVRAALAGLQALAPADAAVQPFASCTPPTTRRSRAPPPVAA